MRLEVVCIGAGPAGLTAAYLLAKAGVAVTVLEADPNHVGGISRTARYKGFLFDIGGHRFFSKSQEVEALWDEMADEPLLQRPRKSRIYYRRRLFEYPLRAKDAFSKLGALESALCVLSYARAALFPRPVSRTFEDWVTNRFGHRLFRIFFRTYTEKVWGMPCSEISADWAAQRIKGLSLRRAIWRSLVPQRSGTPRHELVKTLVDRFRYPRRGPGMLWEAAARKIDAAGGSVLLDRRVTELRRDRDKAGWTVTARAADGSLHTVACDHVISSMPMAHLVASLRPSPPAAVHAAAGALRYRDFLVVALVLKDRDRFDDNWIYIHDPGVKVGRIQNFRSWSPDLVPTPGLTCYGMEYFCFEHDPLWASDDADLVAMAERELLALGLACPGDVVDGTVIRQPKAYPVYDAHYGDNVTALRAELEANWPGLHPVGRNGMHKYNNQDHAMMTAMLTARNILAGRPVYDVWRVNQDAEYHEESPATPGKARSGHPAPDPGRLAPTRA